MFTYVLKLNRSSEKNKTLGGNFLGTLCIIADKCPAGQYPVNNTNCAPCPVGYYKATVGNVACTTCNPNGTTTSTGSTASSQCGQYETSSMPDTQLWLWSVWYGVPCMPNTWFLLRSAWGFAYVQYTALIGVSMVFPVWGQHDVPCLGSAWCSMYAHYTALVMINLLSSVCQKPVPLPLLSLCCSLCTGILKQSVFVFIFACLFVHSDSFF